MAWSVVGAVATSGTSSTVTLTLPAGTQADDWVIIGACARSAATSAGWTFTTPSGFTAISSGTPTGHAHDSTQLTGAVFAKQLSGTQATVDVAGMSAVNNMVSGIVLRGGSTLDTVRIEAGSGATTLCSCSSITTTAADDMVVFLGFQSQASTTSIPPSGFTTQVQQKAAITGGNLAVYIGTLEQTSAGATGTATWTTTGSGRVVGALVSLKVASSGGGGSTNDLAIYGWGGGRGPDGDPLQSTPNDFKANFARMARDVGGDGAVLRMNLTTSYSQATDHWGTWAFNQPTDPNGGPDQWVAIAAVNGCQVLWSVNPSSPTSADKVPKINGTGHMQSWADQWPTILSRYAGPNATIKAGSNVTVKWADGSSSVLTIPDDWPGVLYWEVWNEPNQIGKCAPSSQSTGPLAQTGGGGSNQGRPWYQLVYMINREALNAAKAHASWGSFYLSAITMGGLEPDYLWAAHGGETTTTGVIQYGHEQGFDWNQFHAISMHCYITADPMLATGGTTRRGVPDTIRSDIRGTPTSTSNGLNDYGADQLVIWITEGGNGGSLSGGSEKWNFYKHTVGGQTITSGKAVATHDVNWGHAYGDSGMDAAQAAGDLTQPLAIRNYIRKVRDMNDNHDCRIEMLTLHMFMRTTALTYADASGNDYLYWQKARAFAELTDSDSNRNSYVNASGTPLRSASWLPVAAAYYDERTSSTANTAPLVSITSPADGTTVNDTGITLSATATDPDGAGIASAEYALDPGTGTYGAWTAMSASASAPGAAATSASGMAPVSQNYVANVTLTGSGGAGTVNHLKVRATDSSSDSLVSTTIPIIAVTCVTGVVDAVLPTLTVTAPSGNITVTGEDGSFYTVTGTASDNVGIASLTVNGTEVAVAAGAFSTTVQLAVGANPIVVIARDPSSNSRAVTRTITLQTTPPPVDTLVFANDQIRIGIRITQRGLS